MFKPLEQTATSDGAAGADAMINRHCMCTLYIQYLAVQSASTTQKHSNKLIESCVDTLAAGKRDLFVVIKPEIRYRYAK